MNSRLTFSLLAAALLLCRGLGAQDGNVNGKHDKEFEQRLKKVQAKASGFHRSLARWLSKQGMHEWALKQWDKAINLDEGAAKNKPKRETWSNRPKKALKELWVELEKKLQADSSVKVGAAFAILAKWASDKGLSAKAARACAWAIEYDSHNVKARVYLKHIKNKGRWYGSGQEAIQKVFSENSKVEAGKAIKKQTRAEKAIGGDLGGRRSKHILIESDWLSDDELIRCVQAGEQAFRVYEALFGPTPGSKHFVAKHLGVESQKHYVALIDALHNHSGFNKEAQKKQRAAWLDTDLQLMKVTSGFPDFVVEGVVHFTVEMLLVAHGSALMPWIFEGIAFYFSERIVGTIGWYCTGGTQTTIGRDFHGSFDWRTSTKALVRLGLDPAARLVLRAEANELTTEASLMAWSFMDYILSVHRDKARALVLAMTSEPDSDKEDEAIFQKVFSMSVTEFDTAWRSWVLGTY